jgi:hypothetical protein
MDALTVPEIGIGCLLGLQVLQRFLAGAQFGFGRYRVYWHTLCRAE